MVLVGQIRFFFFLFLNSAKGIGTNGTSARKPAQIKRKSAQMRKEGLPKIQILNSQVKSATLCHLDEERSSLRKKEVGKRNSNGEAPPFVGRHFLN